jgi:hypothetical protein
MSVPKEVNTMTVMQACVARERMHLQVDIDADPHSQCPGKRWTQARVHGLWHAPTEVA